MKRFFFLAFILLSIGEYAYGQQKKTVTITSGSEAGYEQILPADMVYEFPEFQPAKLYFTGKTVADHFVNYHLVNKTLLFKDKVGRILEYAYPEQIKTFIIRDTFWIPAGEGFGKVIYSAENMDIVKCRQTECRGIRKEGAFGGLSGTASISIVTSHQGEDNKKYSFSVPGEYDFETKILYFIRKNDVVLPVSVKNLKKIFPGKKNSLSQIIKSRGLDLSKEKDIISLVSLDQ